MEKGISVNTRSSLGSVLLYGLWIVLLVLEVMALSLSVDAKSLRGDGFLVELLSKSGALSKYILVFAVILTLLIAPKYQIYRSQLLGFQQKQSRWLFLLTQLSTFLCFYLLTVFLFGRNELPGNTQILSIVWIVLGIGLAIVSLLYFAPRIFWQEFFCEERGHIISALLLAGIVYFSANLTQQFWQPMAELTFVLSQWLLGLVYSDVVVDQANMTLGTTAFSVIISPACSGYEGVGLITIFSAVYLWVFKKEFRFPNALLLFPLAIVFIWGLNALRISLLIALGTSYSPTVALEGFHSQAGWIFFITASIFIMLIAHHLRFFSMAPYQRKDILNEADAAPCLLMPLIILLATSLMTSAFIGDFDWLYPIRVLATASVIIYFWKNYQFQIKNIHYEPFLIGFFVCCLWIYLVDQSVSDKQQFSHSLFSVASIWSTVWIVVRCIGSVITVPIAEELVFRGYLLERLTGHPLLSKSRLCFSWFAFLLSSVLFGLMHGEWIAGIIAGMCYAFARYRRNSMGDAIVAHMTTNGLLTLYILLTGSWSLW